MYKRMVVAVDGSETSGKALDEATKLAQEMSSIILLLHVCEEMPIMGVPDGMNMILMQNSSKVDADAGKELLEKHRRLLVEQGITVETKLVETYGGSGHARSQGYCAFADGQCSRRYSPYRIYAGVAGAQIVEKSLL